MQASLQGLVKKDFMNAFAISFATPSLRSEYDALDDRVIVIFQTLDPVLTVISAVAQSNLE